MVQRDYSRINNYMYIGNKAVVLDGKPDNNIEQERKIKKKLPYYREGLALDLRIGRIKALSFSSYYIRNNYQKPR